MWIAQISDPHLRPKGIPYKGVIDPAAALAAAVRQINDLQPLPDLVLLTGDVVDEGHPDEYAAAREILDRLRPRLLAIPGNHDERVAFREAFPEPGSRFLLGSDHLGRSELARVLMGARLSLGVAGAAVAFAVSLGCLLGIIAASLRGAVAAAVRLLCDTALPVPNFLAVLLVASLFEPGPLGLAAAIGLTIWAEPCRVALLTAERAAAAPWVQAARLSGLSRVQVAVRLIAPPLVERSREVAEITFCRVLPGESHLLARSHGRKSGYAAFALTKFNYGALVQLWPDHKGMVRVLGRVIRLMRRLRIYRRTRPPARSARCQVQGRHPDARDLSFLRRAWRVHL